MTETRKKIGQCLELDRPKWWHHAFNPFLVNASFGPASNAIYLAPFEVSDIQRIQPGTLKFKFTYIGKGTRWSYAFRAGIYKLERGTGGTATTLTLVANIGSIARTYLSDPATGTEYACIAIPITVLTLPRDGIYFIAFQWQDTSTLSIPPSSVTWAAFGATLPSFAGWMYFGDGSNTGSLPATIAAFGAASPFRLYFEIK